MRAMNQLRNVILTVLALLLAGGTSAVAASGDKTGDDIDLDAVYRIEEEAFQRPQVTEVISYLTDVYGPRLTGSPNHRAAGDWAVKKLGEYGLKNVHLEKWGPFGRGWVNERFYAHAVSPQAYPLIGYPKAWTPGTKGLVAGEALFI